MLVPLKGWVISFVLLGVLGTGYYRVFNELPLPASEDDRLRAQLAQRWSQKVASEVKRLPGRPFVAVARVVNDSDGILTGQLREWIARRNVRMVNDQWYHRVGYATGVSDEPRTITAAVERLIGGDVDFIVAAEVANWTTYPEFESVLQGHVEILNGQTGESVIEFHLSMPEMIAVVASNDDDEHHLHDGVAAIDRSEIPTEESNDQNFDVAYLRQPQSPAQTSAALSLAPISGLTLWLGSVLTLPLAGCTRLKRLLAKRSNRINTGLLASWVLVTGVLAVILWIRLLPVLSGLLIGIATIMLGAIYFGFCCHCLEKHA